MSAVRCQEVIKTSDCEQVRYRECCSLSNDIYHKRNCSRSRRFVQVELTNFRVRACVNVLVKMNKIRSTFHNNSLCRCMCEFFDSK